MSWFGKIIGGTVGFMFGGPLGAIAGGALGHFFYDRQAEGGGGQWAFGPGQGQRAFGGFSQTERIQATYFITLFSIFGKIAKADGTITRAEGDLVLRFLDQMGVRGEQRDFAIEVFNEAKNSPYTVEQLAEQFARLTRGNRQIHMNLIDMLYQIATADGSLHRTEERQIRSVASTVGLSESDVDSIQGKYGQSSDRYYQVLGVSPQASDEEIRSAYKKLVSDYHPDKITSKGLPDEFVQFATRKFQEIQDAYEHIRNERNLN